MNYRATKLDKECNKKLEKFLYLILDYSHNHYTFKHFGV